VNNKKILSVTIALLSSGFLFGGSGLNIPRTSVFIPSKIGDVALTFNKDHFSVSRNGQHHKVKSYDVDPALRNLKVAGLTAFLKQDGRLSLSKRGDDYAVKMTSGLKGGGPVTGAVAGMVVRGASYGGVLALGSSMLPTGGAAGPVLGGIWAYITGGAGLASTVGVGVISGTAGGTVLVGEVGFGLVSATGSLTQAVTVIETTANSAQAICTLIPWLP